MSYPDCSVVQDKQRTHDLLVLINEKMKDALILFKFQNPNVQTSVHQNTNGPNHSPVWKTQVVPLERN